MGLAQNKNEPQAGHSNCRCAGIAGSRRESRSALARNGRVSSSPARDAGVLKRTANHSARLADQRSCRPLQQACANRSGWRLVPHNVLKGGRVTPVRATACTPRRASCGLPALTRGALDFVQRRRVFQGGGVAEFFAEICCAHNTTRDFRVSCFWYVRDKNHIARRERLARLDGELFF